MNMRRQLRRGCSRALWAACLLFGPLGVANPVRVSPASADLNVGEHIWFAASDGGQAAINGTWEMVEKGAGGQWQPVQGGHGGKLLLEPEGHCRYTPPQVGRMTQFHLRFTAWPAASSAASAPIVTTLRVWAPMLEAPAGDASMANAARRRSTGSTASAPPEEGSGADQAQIKPARLSHGPCSTTAHSAMAGPESGAASSSDHPASLAPEATQAAAASAAPAAPLNGRRRSQLPHGDNLRLDESAPMSDCRKAALATIRFEIIIQYQTWAMEHDLDDHIEELTQGLPVSLPEAFLATCWPHGALAQHQGGVEPPGGALMFPDPIPDLHGRTPTQFMVQFSRYLGTLGAPKYQYLESSQMPPEECLALGEDLREAYGGQKEHWRVAAAAALEGIHSLVHRAVPLLERHLEAQATIVLPDDRSFDSERQKLLKAISKCVQSQASVYEKYEFMYNLIEPVVTLLVEPSRAQ